MATNQSRNIDSQKKIIRQSSVCRVLPRVRPPAAWDSVDSVLHEVRPCSGGFRDLITWIIFFMAKRIEKEKAAPLRGAAFIVNK